MKFCFFFFLSLFSFLFLFLLLNLVKVQPVLTFTKDLSKNVKCLIIPMLLRLVQVLMGWYFSAQLLTSILFSKISLINEVRASSTSSSKPEENASILVLRSSFASYRSSSLFPFTNTTKSPSHTSRPTHGHAQRKYPSL